MGSPPNATRTGLPSALVDPTAIAPAVELGAITEARPTAIAPRWGMGVIAAGRRDSGDLPGTEFSVERWWPEPAAK
ncbi:hypothetical protein BN381_130368 [Candidatus Microthrix parvicella RN1]|uniref:Uncharacterized protein n=1 Tax=Candidatus Neomicrothrix parvicella RN1 TaxID=1229780 RepID=R4YXE4_9ACTN|nr:hypothetical protein BN381_130368 [Candidatus Microthrix parvicella RN1]